MRKSRTAARIRAKNVARACGMSSVFPPLIRYAAEFEFDTIWLDLEHRSIRDSDVTSLLAMAHRYDIDCLVRPPTREKGRLYRYLEDGATGLIIPNVASVEEAQELVQATKFPPIGDRGIDGSGLDNDFALENMSGYAERANSETLLIIQIESPVAVRKINEIAAVPGIDGLFMGPADLQLRLQNEDENISLDEAILRVAKAAAENGIFWGIPCGSREQLESFLSKGAQLLVYGSDFTAVTQSLKQRSEEFKAVLEKLEPN